MADTGVDYAKLGSGAAAVRLTPFELLERLAALVPPPRVHRRRYCGVLAPNAPVAPGGDRDGERTTPGGSDPESTTGAIALRRAARHAWAQLLARIYEVFPLLCPLCATRMRIVAFITEPGTLHAILVHLKRADASIAHRPDARPAAVGHARGRAWPTRPPGPTRSGVRARSQ